MALLASRHSLSDAAPLLILDEYLTCCSPIRFPALEVHSLYIYHYIKTEMHVFLHLPCNLPITPIHSLKISSLNGNQLTA